MRLELTPDEISRFWSKGKPVPSGCIEWQGHINAGRGSNYGRFHIPERIAGKGKKRYVRAHRLAYSLTTGQEIPDGMCVLHTCDNRSCINPAHLYLGTNEDNIKDCVQRARRPRKLSEADVRAIRESDELHVDLAKVYGVCPRTIGKVRSGLLHQHI